MLKGISRTPLTFVRARIYRKQKAKNNDATHHTSHALWAKRAKHLSLPQTSMNTANATRDPTVSLCSFTQREQFSTNNNSPHSSHIGINESHQTQRVFYTHTKRNIRHSYLMLAGAKLEGTIANHHLFF